MKRIIFMSLTTALACVLSLCFTACSDDDNKDMTKPAISSNAETDNPINCQVYHRGDVIPFRYTFTDNVELGNFNIEIHSNHDHHTHSTEAVECEEDHEHEQTTPVNPWIYNQDFSIPAKSQTYVASVDIPIPTDIDPGDYHFMIRVTDKAGWQEIKSIAIEIEE